MSTATIGSVAVQSCEVTMPRVGAWYACGVADEPVPAGRATLTIAGQRFEGTVLAPTAELVPVSAHGFRMVGGAGGLSAVLAPRFYRSPPASLLLTDIASDAGETLASDASMGLSLPSWARGEGTGADALRDLVRRVSSAVWRVRGDGQLWAGVDTWADSGVPDEQVLEVDTEAGLVVLAPDAPTLTPGTTLRGERVSAVVHRVGAGLRSEAWLVRSEEGDASDRVRWALDALVRRSVPTQHLRVYRCRVLQQHADWTLELRPETGSGLPDLSRVPIRSGLPGVGIEVDPGAYVHAIFAGGDAAKPIAALWDVSPGLVRLTFDGGSAAIAREGDDVHAGTVTATVSGNPVVFVYTPHGGVPQPATQTLVLSGGHITSGAGWGRG